MGGDGHLAKGKRVGHQQFEGASAFGTFVKITHEMMRSPAWLDLNMRQPCLVPRHQIKVHAEGETWQGGKLKPRRHQLHKS